MIDKIVITIVCLLVGFMFGWYGNSISSLIKSRNKCLAETAEIQRKIDALKQEGVTDE